jgi:hypothetical protein
VCRLPIRRDAAPALHAAGQQSTVLSTSTPLSAGSRHLGSQIAHSEIQDGRADAYPNNSARLKKTENRCAHARSRNRYRPVLMPGGCRGVGSATFTVGAAGKILAPARPRPSTLLRGGRFSDQTCSKSVRDDGSPDSEALRCRVISICLSDSTAWAGTGAARKNNL